MVRWRCQPNWLTWNYLYVEAEETITNRRCINLEHSLLNTRNPSYTGQSQSGILFLHQLLIPTQYLPSSVGSPLFRTAQPFVAVIAWLSQRRMSHDAYHRSMSLLATIIQIQIPNFETLVWVTLNNVIVLRVVIVSVLSLRWLADIVQPTSVMQRSR